MGIRESFRYKRDMSEKVSDYEKLGSFYLGKDYDLEKRGVTEDL